MIVLYILTSVHHSIEMDKDKTTENSYFGSEHLTLNLHIY